MGGGNKKDRPQDGRKAEEASDKASKAHGKGEKAQDKAFKAQDNSGDIVTVKVEPMEMAKLVKRREPLDLSTGRVDIVICAEEDTAPGNDDRRAAFSPVPGTSQAPVSVSRTEKLTSSRGREVNQDEGASERLRSRSGRGPLMTADDEGLMQIAYDKTSNPQDRGKLTIETHSPLLELVGSPVSNVSHVYTPQR